MIMWRLEMKLVFCFVLLVWATSAKASTEAQSIPPAASPSLTGKPGLLGVHNRSVVCQVTYSADRHPADFSSKDIKRDLCTHLLYDVGHVNGETGALKSSAQALKYDYASAQANNRFPYLKVLLSVGGDEDTTALLKIAANSELQHKFIESVMAILRDHAFHGVNLNVKADRNVILQESDKKNLLLLVQNLHTSLQSGNQTLTVSLSDDRRVMEQLYDMAPLSELADLIIIMAYDYHGPWDPTTGPGAPLSTNNPELGSVAGTLKYLKSVKTPLDKLVLGIPLFGRISKLEATHDPKTAIEQTLGIAIKSQGFIAPDHSLMAYHQICQTLDGDLWQQSWDGQSRTPFASNGSHWLSFEDTRSVTAKAQYAVHHNLAGVMVAALDLDDFSGVCSTLSTKKSFPLLSTINSAMLESPTENWDLDDPSAEYRQRGVLNGFEIFLVVVFVVLCAVLIVAGVLFVYRYAQQLPVSVQ